MFALLDPDEIHSACETYKQLKDLIISLKCVTPSFEQVYAAVRVHDYYSDFSKDDIKEIYEEV